MAIRQPKIRIKVANIISQLGKDGRHTVPNLPQCIYALLQEAVNLTVNTIACIGSKDRLWRSAPMSDV